VGHRHGALLRPGRPRRTATVGGGTTSACRYPRLVPQDVGCVVGGRALVMHLRKRTSSDPSNLDWHLQRTLGVTEPCSPGACASTGRRMVVRAHAPGGRGAARDNHLTARHRLSPVSRTVKAGVLAVGILGLLTVITSSRRRPPARRHHDNASAVQSPVLDDVVGRCCSSGGSPRDLAERAF
jgi:hypothetical protein